MTRSEYNIQMILYGIISGLIVISFGLAFYVVSLVNEQPEKRQIIEQTRTKLVYDTFLRRMEINEALENNDKLYYHSIGFYSEVAGSQEIAKQIVKHALDKKVPVNIAFALAFVESSFRSKVVQDNSDGSKDRGLFQINSRYFDDIEWFNVKDNTVHALTYLREKYDKFSSWPVASLLYNAGSSSNVSEYALRHMNRVLKKERELNVRFNTFRRNSNFSEPQNRN